MLKIENFSKSYTKGKFAVHQLSLEVHAGDIYAFIGHNGAGKTTTIKAVAGILPFDEGEITIDGISIRENPMLCKQKIAYIPDNPDLYDSLTGIQYLNFIGDVFGVESTQRKADIQKYAALFEIDTNLNSPISSYSHGMKQKLVITSALIHHPKLMILDEPFVGLDPKAAFTVKNIMKEFCDEGNAIFFSTHVLEVAEKLCNKIAIIKAGELITCGPMQEVKGNQSLEEVFLELTDHE